MNDDIDIPSFLRRESIGGDAARYIAGCVFCDEQISGLSWQSVINVTRRHVETCDQHPMRKLEAEIRRLLPLEKNGAELAAFAAADTKTIEQLKRERDALQAFKDYTHQRLDEDGVELDPESPHKAAGCRIGGRLDIVFRERDKYRKEVAHLKNIGYLQKYCDDFNAVHKVGTKGYLTLDSGEKKPTHITNNAWVLGGHSAVILVDGITGCYLLERFESA